MRPFTPSSNQPSRVNSMPLPQDLYEDLRKEFLAEGRAEGELRQARAAVGEAFAAHFDVVPDAVQRAVSQAQDIDQLHRWHRAVIRAQNEAAAQQAILGDH